YQHAGPLRGGLSPTVLPRGAAGLRYLEGGAAAHAAPADARGGGAPQRYARGSGGIALAPAAGAGYRRRGPTAPERVDASQLDRLPLPIPGRHRDRAGALPGA